MLQASACVEAFLTERLHASLLLPRNHVLPLRTCHVPRAEPPILVQAHRSNVRTSSPRPPGAAHSPAAQSQNGKPVVIPRECPLGVRMVARAVCTRHRGGCGARSRRGGVLRVDSRHSARGGCIRAPSTSHAPTPHAPHATRDTRDTPHATRTTYHTPHTTHHTPHTTHHTLHTTHHAPHTTHHTPHTTRHTPHTTHHTPHTTHSHTRARHVTHASSSRAAPTPLAAHSGGRAFCRGRDGGPRPRRERRECCARSPGGGVCRWRGASEPCERRGDGPAVEPLRGGRAAEWSAAELVELSRPQRADHTHDARDERPGQARMDDVAREAGR
eukprot:7375891-Prymnesium_polylepis.2